MCCKKLFDLPQLILFVSTFLHSRQSSESVGSKLSTGSDPAAKMQLFDGKRGDIMIVDP
jgi:hypothetical protein